MDLQVYSNRQFGAVRMVMRNGEPWFVAADVCRCLEIGNSRMATDRLDADEKGVIPTDTPGGKQNMTIINESGLYTLILGSRKPEARAFRRWITHEVIPSIRRTGAYTAPIASQEPQTECLIAQCLQITADLITCTRQLLQQRQDAARSASAEGSADDHCQLHKVVQYGVAEEVQGMRAGGMTLEAIAQCLRQRGIPISSMAVYRYLRSTGR